MKIDLTTLGKNVNQLTLGDRQFLFSYNTLVAALCPIKGYFKSNIKYSKTTSKHINQWFDDAYIVQVVDPKVLEDMMVGRV